MAASAAASAIIPDTTYNATSVVPSATILDTFSPFSISLATSQAALIYGVALAILLAVPAIATPYFP